MAGRKKSEEEKERLKKLRSEARKIIGAMDQHKLFGFILHHRGKKAIPMLMELWGGGMAQEEKELPSEGGEEKPGESVPEKEGREEPAPAPDDLIELVLDAKKKKKG